jgi:hypothetical protein
LSSSAGRRSEILADECAARLTRAADSLHGEMRGLTAGRGRANIEGFAGPSRQTGLYACSRWIDVPNPGQWVRSNCAVGFLEIYPVGIFSRAEIDSRGALVRTQGQEHMVPGLEWTICDGLNWDHRLTRGYFDAIGLPISLPIRSPEITSSTRRFFCRPAAVSFDATG